MCVCVSERLSRALAGAQVHVGFVVCMCVCVGAIVHVRRVSACILYE